MNSPATASDRPSTAVQIGRWRDRKGIAEHFGISERSVGNLMRRRLLPYVKLGRIVRFDLGACETAVKAFELHAVARHPSLA